MAADNKDRRMSLMGHLGELRRRLTIIAVAILAGSLVFYFFAPFIIKILVAPAMPYIYIPVEKLDDPGLYVFGLLDGFTLKFFVGFVTSIFVTSPIWLWQILAFFVPALNQKERRWFFPTFTAGVILFLGGAVFCYFLILDPAFAFLIGQSDDFGNVMLEATRAVDVVLLFLVAFGVAFELPLVIFYLTVFNIVPHKKLRKSWRVVYIVLLVLSAFITPDANPVTMILMFAALVVLYEGSLFVSRIVLNKRIKEREAREAAEAAEEARMDEALATRKKERLAREAAEEEEARLAAKAAKAEKVAKPSKSADSAKPAKPTKTAKSDKPAASAKKKKKSNA